MLKQPRNARPGRPALPRDESEPAVTRTLDRGLSILEFVASAGEASLSEIARATEMSASTTFRLIETLERRGFVSRTEETGMYRIGSRAFDVGSSFSGAARLNEIARPLMRRLAQELGDVVALGIREGKHVMYVEQFEGKSTVRMMARLGTRLPVHATAVGKVLVAWLWESRIDEILGEEPYERATPETLISRSTLLNDLAQVRQRGYAVDAQEYRMEVRCMAAPIRNREGEVVAALSISAPAGRLLEEQTLQNADVLKSIANEISSRLGWRDQPNTVSQSDQIHHGTLFED